MWSLFRSLIGLVAHHCSDRMPQHPWKQLCTWNDSHFHTLLLVQVILSLRLHCSIRTFHSSNFLVTSNTRLCQSRCFVSSSLYSSSNLDDAWLPIRLDLDTFLRTQESKHHLHAALICLRAHFCRGQVAIVLADHHENCRFRSRFIHECPFLHQRT